jgi:urease subunit beta/urease subunit gamma/beta
MMVKAGEWILSDQPVAINAGRRTVRLSVHNTGDRPIQVGSHFHFFEVNRALDFDRPQTMGMHLNIPAGTAVRFEPGDEKDVDLVEFGGMKRILGFNGLVNGSVQATWTVKEALQRARNLEFGGRGYLEQEEAAIINRQTKERRGKERAT